MTSEDRALLPVLDFLQRQLAGTLHSEEHTHLKYPTAISRLLDLQLLAVSERSARIGLLADVDKHGNQQGTIHGGTLCELADAAIGTAHSTIIGIDESFTSLDLNARFLRPAWSGKLFADAHCTHAGRTISQYICEITRDDGKPIATVTSAVLTLRGEAARGR
ncbi:MAG: thioesterase [Microbacterium sp. 69-10]|uniref:PaaI family thioesterase n=1 Tax=Microbacterium sp. 69-10 TaxID=1895783 RepID=UPI0009616DBF|nr:PaaI family thioesterase [Microbacterium sp. 69-10]OJU41497.1 MAG: thioesterase [Microbacterium sp. 69-10]